MHTWFYCGNLMERSHWEDVDWIDLAQHSDKCQAVMKMAIIIIINYYLRNHGILYLNTWK
jgi:hypothetical protein